MFLKRLWRQISEQGFVFYVLLVSLLVLALVIWSVWDSVGDHQQIPVEHLWIGALLLGINLILAIIALDRDRYASYLLLGSTLVLEVMTISFLYRV